MDYESAYFDLTDNLQERLDSCDRMTDNANSVDVALMWAFIKFVNESPLMDIDSLMPIIMDKDAREWIADYEEYVRWCEHGNESSISSVGGIAWFYNVIQGDSKGVLDYLLSEEEQSDERAKDLAVRLLILNKRFGH